MREIRIFQPGSYRLGETIELSAEAGQHVGVVLRLQAGDKIVLFCGNNCEFDAFIVTVHKKKVSVTIEAEREVNRESPRVIHLAQALSKGERMELVMQKAVELGVASITPLITARSVVKLDQSRMEKKLAQWQAIVIAACEQSGRNLIPRVNSILTLADYLQQGRDNHQLKFLLDPWQSKTWRDYQFAQYDINLLIGPEGGFSQEELKQIFAADFKALSLGPRILRTETAAITALSVLQAVCGDL